MNLVLLKGLNGAVAINPKYIVSVQMSDLDEVIVYTTIRSIQTTESISDVIQKIQEAMQ